MPTVIQCRSADDERAAVRRAADALQRGELVVFPTETVYGVAANARDESAVARLLAAKGRRPGQPLALAVADGEQAVGYCACMSPVARRLARRCWPGPVTLVLPAASADRMPCPLPPAVRDAVLSEGWVGLRVPDHRFVRSAIRLLGAPLTLTSANRSGGKDPVEPSEVLQTLGDCVGLVLSDGRAKYAKPSTVVRVEGNRVRVLRAGVVSRNTLRGYASLIVLLVCTGNTCRSPMAQVLLQKRVADRLGCSIDQLREQGVMIISAGVAAARGAAASPEAVEAMKQRGLDLADHLTQPLSDVLVRFADVILTMTDGHRQAILSKWPEAAQRTALLRHDQQDIADPFCAPLEVYLRCAEQIDAELEQWMDRIDWRTRPELEPAT